MSNSDLAELSGHAVEIGARVISVAAITEAIMTRSQPDCIALHLEWSMRGASSDAHSQEQALAASWRLIDDACARILQCVERDTLTLIVSPGHAGRDGFLIAHRRFLDARSSISSPAAADIAPTILAWFGLAASGLPGRAIGWLGAEAAGAHLREMPRAPVEITRKTAVVPAGYLGPPPPKAFWRAKRLGRLAALALQEDPRVAADLVMRALSLAPDDLNLLDLHVTALIGCRRFDGIPAIAENIRKAAPDDLRGDFAEGAYHALVGSSELASPLLDRVLSGRDRALCLRVARIWAAVGRPELADKALESAANYEPPIDAAI